MVWEVIGKLFAVYILARILLSIWKKLRAFFFPLLGWRINYKSYGQWAVVTGATDGIGKAYALELAKLGMKVVLISRTQEKLDQIAKEIGEKHKVETKTIAFDFGARAGYEKIENELSSLDIGVLVNNVGMGYEYPEWFNEVAVETFEKMINVNMLSLVKMTHIVLKGMLERKKGVMIHVSSASASLPVPLLTVYSASKAFVDFFARALQWEYRDKGIISQSLTPFFVATKLAGVRPSLFCPMPDQFVKQALGTVGIMDRSTGYIMHNIQSMLYSCIPTAILEKNTVSMMAGIRKRALKKREKKE